MGERALDEISVYENRPVFPIPHFAVLTLNGIAYARWMGRQVPIDLRSDSRSALPAPLHQPLPLVHFWPIYTRLDHPDRHDADGMNALFAARDLTRRYELDDHIHPELGPVELEPTQGDVHYIHPALMACELGAITAQATMIVRHDFRDSSYTVIRPLTEHASQVAGSM